MSSAAGGVTGEGRSSRLISLKAKAGLLVRQSASGVAAQQAVSQMLRTKPRGLPDIEKFTDCFSMVLGPLQVPRLVQMPWAFAECPNGAPPSKNRV
jgi:hypothetical protein